MPQPFPLRMTSPVEWRDDGTPHATRFDDIYRSSGLDGQGGLTQARHVFLAGCGLIASTDPREAGLPAATREPLWNGQAQWHVLENGFGLGLNFLATWAAWRTNADRPSRLFFTSIEAWPVSSDDLRRSTTPFPELTDLAEQLASQWQAMTPGMHRLVFEDGAVQLTVCVGDSRQMLRELDVAADSIFLDGFSPKCNPEMWDLPVLKGVARLSRPGTRVATWSFARSVRDGLQQCGFEIERRPGVPPKRDALAATFAPRWTPRHLQQLRAAFPVSRQPARRAVVVGAGISGSSVARSLATRGWQVTVLDAASTPAAGASGLPVGLFAPHVSPDDGPLSQLTRAGLRSMRLRCASLLRQNEDWSPSGVLELPIGRERRLPEQWRQAQAKNQLHVGLQSSRLADSHDLAAWHEDVQILIRKGQLEGHPLWHAQAGWVRPTQLVQAQLQHPNIRWLGHSAVACIRRTDTDPPAKAGESAWQVFDQCEQLLATGDLLVLAAGPVTAKLMQPWLTTTTFPTHAVHGLVSLGDDTPPYKDTPPVNGHGSHLRGIPDGQNGHFWCAGASFLRDLSHGFDARVIAAEHQANTQRLLELLPSAGAWMANQMSQNRLRHWHGTRCTVADRVPMVGPTSPTDPAAAPWVSTAMGARGLTLAVLAGELLAAWLHGEPLPLPLNLAHKLKANRFAAS